MNSTIYTQIFLKVFSGFFLGKMSIVHERKLVSVPTEQVDILKYKFLSVAICSEFCILRIYVVDQFDLFLNISNSRRMGRRQTYKEEDLDNATL